MSKINIITPVYNEFDTIQPFITSLKNYINSQNADDCFHIIVVDDGSAPSFKTHLKELQVQHNFHLISLQLNQGQQIALIKGLQASRADAYITMDSDFQDPIEYIGALVYKWKQGYDVVNMVRESRSQDSFFKKAFARVFYYFFHLLSFGNNKIDSGDYRLIDHSVVKKLLIKKSQRHYLRAELNWLSNNSFDLKYARPARKYGRSKYTFYKSLKLAYSALLVRLEYKLK